MLTLDADSSIISTDLSGKYLSVIYLLDNSTACFIASSVIFTLWFFSYLFFKPFNIFIASSFVGSSTIIGCSLLSNATSFSIFFLYSSIVVAPIT